MLYYKSTYFPREGEGEAQWESYVEMLLILHYQKLPHYQTRKYFTTRNCFTTRVSFCNIFLACWVLKTLSYFSSPHDIHDFFFHSIFNVCPFIIPFTQKAIRNISSKIWVYFQIAKLLWGCVSKFPSQLSSKLSKQFSDSLALSIISLLLISKKPYSKGSSQSKSMSYGHKESRTLASLSRLGIAEFSWCCVVGSHQQRLP